MRFFHFQRLRPLFLLAVLLVLSAGQPLFAQAPTWQDAVSPGGGQGNSTAVDAAGNTYVTGYFNGTAIFGATTLISAGANDVFVAKRTPAGAWLWAVSAGGSDIDTGLGVAVDGSGNVVVTGYFNSPTIVFGATTLTNAGVRDLFVAQLTPTGTWQWATSAGGSGSDGGNSVAVDGSSNVVVTGFFNSPTIAFGTTTLTNAGGNDLFVAKLTPTGVWQWAAGAGGSRFDVGNGVAVDGGGNVVVTGVFSSPTISFGATTLTNAGGNDVFVAQLTPAGAWQWATGAGGNDDDYSYGVAVDGSGNVVVTGAFYSPAISFGATALTNAGNSDLFVAKLTPAGVWQWATSAGGSGIDYGWGVAVDGSGNVVVTGYFYSPTIPFGATTLTSAGANDIFVAKLTPTGVWQWATGAGGSGADYGFGVAVDGSGSVVITGYFNSPTIALGATTLANPTFTLPALLLARLSTVTGQPDEPTQPAFTLAPNPAHTTVQVMGAAGTTATLLDGLGRVVRTWHLEPGTSNLDISALPAGLYLVRAGSSKAQRLVVE